VSYTSQQEVVWESSQKFNTEQVTELFELNMSQVLGQQIRRIVFAINEIKGDKAFINDFTNVMEVYINMFRSLLSDDVGGDEN